MKDQTSSPPMVLVNGEPGQSISVFDRGLAYGDGLFETIAVQHGEPLLWDRHYQRLAQTATRLGIKTPTKECLSEEISTLSSGIEKAVVKIILTRGVGGRGYAPPENSKPTRIISLHDWPDYAAEMFTAGVRLRVCDFRLAKQPLLAGLKHLNRLEQVMARSEWSDPEIFEGLLLDEQQHIIEATMSNVFLINDQQLLTPDLSESGVNGVVRQSILTLAAEMGFQTRIQNLQMDDVYRANEMFLCNSVLGVCPVRQVDDYSLPSLEGGQAIRAYLMQRRMIAKP